MSGKSGNSLFEEVVDLFKTFFFSIFRAFGRMLGGSFVAGVVGSLGGAGVSLYYGYPLVPWLIGGFVVCAVVALVLMVFIASDL